LTREAGGALAISVEPGRPAAAGERLTLLPPGPYLLDLRIARASDSPPAELTLDLACKGGAGETVLNRFSTEPNPAPATVSMGFDLPATCEAQHWSIGATSRSIEAPATVIISGMDLSRTQPDEGQPVGPKAL
jgi:hypothetical protein